MARSVVAVLCLTVAAGGCFGSDDDEPEAVPTPSTPVRVVRDDGSLPARCGVRETATRVVQFLDAIGRGDRDALDQLLADSDRFQWFSSSGSPRGFAAYGRTATIERPDAGDGRPRLMRYLQRRHGANERIRLLTLEVTKVRPGSWLPREVGVVTGVTFTVRRTARDLAGGKNRIASGKGGLACSDSTVVVWTMGLETGRRLPQRVHLCGDQVRRGLVLACTPAV